MHILWIKTELLHPIDKGGRIRTYNMLRALKREHRVTYLTLDNGNAAPDAAQRALEYCHELIRVPFRETPRRSARFWMELAGNVLSPLPYAVAKYRSPDMRKAIDRAVRQADVDLVVCDFLFPSLNVPAGLPARTVLFQHNVEAMIWRRHVDVQSNALSRAYFAEQWRRMRRFEHAECRRFDSVVAVSRADAEVLEREYGLSAVSDVPTGVDTEFFRPTAEAPVSPPDLVFTGSMDWMPNEDGILWFVDQVMPRVHEQMRDVTLTIVGRNPPPRIRALADRDQRFRVTGTVPDVRPYLQRASVAVIPLRVGGGTRLKLFEALAMERPLVSTTIGAEGLPVEAGRHCMIADEPAAFALQVVNLLRDPDRARAIGREGAEYVRGTFSWEKAAQVFSQLALGEADAARVP